MKPGWKNRIEERRYFEEKQEKKRFELTCQMAERMRMEEKRINAQIGFIKNLVTFDLGNPLEAKA